MLDLSLNEISVHYLGHTEAELEKPYMDIEHEIIFNNQEFIDYYTLKIPLFGLNNLDKCLDFLNRDSKYLSKIIKERTL